MHLLVTMLPAAAGPVLRTQKNMMMMTRMNPKLKICSVKEVSLKVLKTKRLLYSCLDEIQSQNGGSGDDADDDDDDDDDDDEEEDEDNEDEGVENEDNEDGQEGGNKDVGLTAGGPTWSPEQIQNFLLSVAAMREEDVIKTMGKNSLFC